MKKHLFHGQIVVFLLVLVGTIFAGPLVTCVVAQDFAGLPTAEKSDDKAAAKSDGTATAPTDSANGAMADAAAKPAGKTDAPNVGTAPAAESTMLEKLWKTLNLEVLLKNNGIKSWACLLGYIFAGMVLGKIASVLLARFASAREGVAAKLFSDMAGPTNLALITLGIFGGLLWLNLTPDLLEFSQKTVKLMFTIAVYWYLNNLIGMVDPLLHRLGRNSASALDKHVAPLVRRSLRVFLIILTVMYVLKDVFDKDIGAWLAGLGIAGIAVSLAAQDSLKNLFGSITIILDRPFKIGDRIICTGYEGVIEDIGFRSTKVRTNAGYLVSIPNANVVNSPIENISRRPGIRRNFAIHLPTDTPAEKVRQVAVIVRNLLNDDEFREATHPRINGELSKPQVAWGDVVNSSLTLTVAYWYPPAKSAEFSQHCEKLTVRILEAFEGAGISIAKDG
jgi:MscS family membrane protein